MINHSSIVAYFKAIAENLVGVNGFFRMDLTEIQGSFRSTANFPCLVIESHEGDLGDSNLMSSVNDRTFAFTIFLNPKNDDYDSQNEFLNTSEELGLKVIARMRHDARVPDHLLNNAFKASDVTYSKVGPLFQEALYGYRFVGSFSKHQPLKVVPADWDDIDAIC